MISFPSIFPNFLLHFQSVLYVAVQQYLLEISYRALSSSLSSSLDQPLEVDLEDPPAGIKVIEGNGTTSPIISLMRPPPNVPYLAFSKEDGFVRFPPFNPSLSTFFLIFSPLLP